MQPNQAGRRSSLSLHPAAHRGAPCVRVLATSSEPGFAVASGFLDGLALPLKSTGGRIARGPGAG